MSAPQTLIADAIQTAITGATDVGTVIRGATVEVLANLSTDAATVSIEYGALEPIDANAGQTIVGKFDGKLDVYLDVYWAGPPAVWESRIFECCAAIWRQVQAMTLPAVAIRVRPFGHEAPEIDTRGDNQHVVVRNTYRFDVRFSINDPEA
jgi:hypothetical protein